MFSIPKSPKALFNKAAAGVGGAVVATQLASMAGIQHPIVGYAGSLVAGGPVGLVVKLGFDMFTGSGFNLGSLLGGGTQAAGGTLVI